MAQRSTKLDSKEKKVNTFYTALGQFVVRFRYAIIAAWVLFGIICSIALPSLGSVVKTTQSDFLPGNSPSLQAEKLALHFNNQKTDKLASLTLVAVTTHGALTAVEQSAITRLEGAIRRLAHVKSVQDLSTSPDLRARQAVIWADVPQTGGAVDDTLIGGIRSAFARAPAGLTYHLTGDLVVGYDEQKQSASADSAAQLLSILVVIIL